MELHAAEETSWHSDSQDRFFDLLLHGCIAGLLETGGEKNNYFLNVGWVWPSIHRVGVQTGWQVGQLHQPGGAALRVLAFSPTGTLLAAGGDDEKVTVWDLASKNIHRTLCEHESMVTALAFTPGTGALLVSGTFAGELKVWDGGCGHGVSLLTRAEAHDLGVSCCTFRPSHQGEYMLASCGNDDQVRLWKLIYGSGVTLVSLATLSGHVGNVMCVAFSPTSSLLASGTHHILPTLDKQVWFNMCVCDRAGDKRVIIWDTDSGRKLQDLTRHQRYVTCCAWSADGEVLASGSNDRMVVLWGAGTGKTVDQPANSSPPALVGWTVSQVAEWLGDVVRLPQYREVFCHNHIDGLELLHLTHDSLLHSLKIESMGHRNQILRGIQLLRDPLSRLSPLDSEACPEEFLCPITHEAMVDPVVAADGYSYEKEAIQSWLTDGRRTSPMTNQTLPHVTLVPNHALRLLIHKYLLWPHHSPPP
ncbi:WDSUB1 [Cordylochernes scorpioides]|uniref:WD repeat, SAM and U-box domain-containing protein 1 n=1 Tax=Cordylochernes scorpioides TaxID=51811 RepID=A0ABY6K3Y3_9ARAC|nr:WDSUB1 [Cordylochernes scorpioides]